MNDYELGAEDGGAGLWDGLTGAANAAANLIGVLKGGNKAAAPVATIAPGAQRAAGVPVWAWVAGGGALLLGIVLVLRKP